MSAKVKLLPSSMYLIQVHGLTVRGRGHGRRNIRGGRPNRPEMRRQRPALAPPPAPEVEYLCGVGGGGAVTDAAQHPEVAALVEDGGRVVPGRRHLLHNAPLIRPLELVASFLGVGVESAEVQAR